MQAGNKELCCEDATGGVIPQATRSIKSRVFSGFDVARGKNLTVVVALRNQHRKSVKSVVINAK